MEATMQELVNELTQARIDVAMSSGFAKTMATARRDAIESRIFGIMVNGENYGYHPWFPRDIDEDGFHV